MSAPGAWMKGKSLTTWFITLLKGGIWLVPFPAAAINWVAERKKKPKGHSSREPRDREPFWGNPLPIGASKRMGNSGGFDMGEFWETVWEAKR